ncbi:alpha/beta hydrolase [Actinomyces minihominis]|uniref:alpha/beta hydrolase n=1 Tax=Actinomyces minihominis TaxID=2002838 RepID=UPI000C078577|nr:alpha/beta hydrolase [Actinomyces minihominis]
MSEVEITTPRGVTLRGTFVSPVDTQDAAVVFSHSFLCDRQSSPHFPLLAARYRQLGYATLIFDYSGHGASDDDPITSENRVEDLRAASGWLADQGFNRQLLHAHSSGSISALRSRPKAVKAVFLSSPILGPLDFEWEKIFSPDQLEELERQHETRIYEDTNSGRTSFQVTQQTLIDLSLNTAESLLTGLEQPTMILFDEGDVERGVDVQAKDVVRLLPEGSHLEIASGEDFSREDQLPAMWKRAEKWVRDQVPLARKTR